MPPKGSKKSAPAPPNKTLVLDNGAYTIKAGLVAAASESTYDDCSVIPNCIARSTRDKCTYVGAELDSCKDFGELAFRRPVEKGFIGGGLRKGVSVFLPQFFVQKEHV